ncbi:MAG: GNAT family N-acetyltransferase [Actinobacteria bacterium]|nr:GNAT family N-acetyltransferase [Actinomycetota bacterium]
MVTADEAGGAAPRAVPVTRELMRGAAEAAAEGFLDNEIWVWMLPREWQRRRLLPRHYRWMIRSVYMPRSAAWTTPDAAGTALWFPPGTLWLRGFERLAEAASLLPEGIDCFRRALRWEELISEHHPRERYWYLQTLSVRPSAQRGGIGTALIRPGLDRADEAGVSTYLETQRFSNVPFYERFGFELTGEVSLPDSPPVWLMSRPPGGGGA